MYSLKNPASKLTRIRLDLEEYDFAIEHIRGSNNVVADALSRISIAELKECIFEEENDTKCVTEQHKTEGAEKPVKKWPVNKILAITRSMSRENSAQHHGLVSN